MPTALSPSFDRRSRSDGSVVACGSQCSTWARTPCTCYSSTRNPGARPLPAYEHKIELLLSELLDDKGRVTSDGIDRLVAFCAEALEIAEDKGAESMLAFATSALREATNGDKVIERIRDKTGLDLRVLGGEDEARLTFLAVRRWYGWSSGRLLCLDIGGGSLEIAVGIDEDPDAAASLPLGAGRLTRTWFTADPPAKSEIRELRRHVRAQVASAVGAVSRFGRPRQGGRDEQDAPLARPGGRGGTVG